MDLNELKTMLERLGLSYLAKNLPDFVARMTKNKASVQEMVEEISRREIEERHRRGVERRVNGAKLGRYRPLVDFDWNWPKKIDRVRIEELFKLTFIDEPANVILVGPSGVGKTMIAKNLCYHAALAGHSTLFVEASEMLGDLEAQDSPRSLKTRLSRYTKPQLLCIDEVGYLSYSGRAADLMFQVVSKRYEKGATVISTNVAFKDWSQVFPGAACVVAMLDRLTHRAEILPIEGESYRLREASSRKKKTRGVTTHQVNQSDVSQ